jgi:RHS repeat-associated protein
MRARRWFFVFGLSAAACSANAPDVSTDSNSAPAQSAALQTSGPGEYCQRIKITSHECQFGFFANPIGNSRNVNFTIARLGSWTSAPSIVQGWRADKCYGGGQECALAKEEDTPAFSFNQCTALPQDEEFLSPPPEQPAIYASPTDGPRDMGLIGEGVSLRTDTSGLPCCYEFGRERAEYVAVGAPFLCPDECPASAPYRWNSTLRCYAYPEKTFPDPANPLNTLPLCSGTADEARCEDCYANSGGVACRCTQLSGDARRECECLAGGGGKACLDWCPPASPHRWERDGGCHPSPEPEVTPRARPPKPGGPPAVPAADEERGGGAEGEPVELMTGTWFHHVNLLSLPGRGLPIDVALKYSTLEWARQRGTKEIGRGWTRSYDRTVTIAGTRAWLFAEDGVAYEFAETATPGVFALPGADPSVERLERDSSGQIRYVQRDGTTELYDASGTLTEVRDRYGSALSFQWSAAAGSRTLTITNSVTGQSVALLHEAAEGDPDLLRLVAVRDTNDARSPDDTTPLREARLEYDEAGRLVAIRDVVGESFRYHYDGPGRIERVYDRRNDPDAPGSKSLVNVYDANRPARVVHQDRGNGVTTSFDWTPQADWDLTVLISGNGTYLARHIKHDANGRIVRRYHPYWTNDWTEISYDPVTGLRTREKDPHGRIRTWSYDPATMDLLESTLAPATSFEAKTTFGYGAFGLRNRVVHPDGREETFDFSTLGAPLAHRVFGRCANGAATCDDRPVEVTTFEANAFGEVTATTAPTGAKTCFIRDGFGRTTRTVHAATADCSTSLEGVTESFAWDARHYLVRAVDARGLVTTWQVRNDGKPVVEVADDRPSGRAVRTTFRYDAEGNLVERVEDAGDSTHANATTRWEWALVGGEYAWAPIERVDPVGAVTRYRYDGLGTMSERREVGVQPDGSDRVHRALFVHDRLGWQRQSLSPDGTVLRDEFFDATGLLTETRDGRGVVHKYTYDPAGRIATRVLGTSGVSGQPSYSATYTETWDAVGRPLLTIGPNGHRIERAYDAFGRLSATTDGAGRRVTWTRSIADRTETIVRGAEDPSQAEVVTRRFDRIGRLLSEERDPNGRKILNRWEYGHGSNAVDRALEVRDGTTTRYEHDVFGRLAATVGDGNLRWTWEYDNLNRVRSRIDPRGRHVTYGHDLAGRLRTRTEELATGARVESWTWGPDGTLRTRTDFAGRVSAFQYDVNGRLASIDWAPHDATPDVTFAYEASGLLKSVTDAGGTTRYVYDALDRLAIRERTWADGAVDVLTHKRNAVGDLEELTTNGATLGLEHDAGGRLTHITPWGATKSTTPTLTFWSNGRPSSVTPTGAVESRFAVEGGSALLVGIEHRVSTRSHDMSFGHDVFGRANTLVDRTGTTTVTRDSFGRISTLQKGVAPSLAYEYDATGNRTRGGATLATFDDRDRIAGYEYDANDNLLFDGQTSYTYDSANRLVQSEKPGVLTKYEYDGLGQLVAQTVNGDRVRFVLDESGPLPRVSSIVRSDRETFIAHGPQGIHARVTRVGGNLGPVEYALVDRLGSVREWVRGDGTPVETIDYDIFGNVDRRCAGGAPQPTQLSQVSTTTVSAAPKTLLVTGPAHENALGGLRAALAKAGDFIERDQSVVTVAEIAAASVVILSDSINTWEFVPRAGIIDALRASPATIISMESLLLDDLGMTGPTRWADYAVATDIDRLVFADGRTVQIATSAGNVHWGAPAASATVHARIDAGRAAWFEYAPGARLADGTNAKGRRIHFYLGTETALSNRATPAAVADLERLVAVRERATLPSSACAALPSNEGFFGFTGEWHSPDGTIHLRARTYLPSIGRFLQRDAFEGFPERPMSLNRGTYAENDPIELVDPSGYTGKKFGGAADAVSPPPSYNAGLGLTGGASAALPGIIVTGGGGVIYGGSREGSRYAAEFGVVASWSAGVNVGPKSLGASVGGYGYGGAGPTFAGGASGAGKTWSVPAGGPTVFGSRSMTNPKGLLADGNQFALGASAGPSIGKPSYFTETTDRATVTSILIGVDSDKLEYFHEIRSYDWDGTEVFRGNLGDLVRDLMWYAPLGMSWEIAGVLGFGPYAQQERCPKPKR